MKPSLLVASLLMLGLAIYFRIEWPLYIAPAMWVALGAIAFLEEKAKRSNHRYLAYDRIGTVTRYVFVLQLLLFNFFAHQLDDSYQNNVVQALFTFSLVAWVALSRHGDVYYLLDDAGIKTRHRKISYEKITAVRITSRVIELHLANRKTFLAIPLKLLTTDMREFLELKIPVISAPQSSTGHAPKNYPAQ